MKSHDGKKIENDQHFFVMEKTVNKNGVSTTKLFSCNIQLTGEYLDSLDECIKALQRMTQSRYKVKNITKDIAGDRLLQCVLHINAYNLDN